MKDYFQFLLAQTEGGEAAPSAVPGGETAGETESGTQQPGAEGEDVVPQKKPGLFDSMAFPLILMVVVMYFMLFRGPKKKQKERKTMLDSMQKNDRVQTIGGILGTVVDLRDDEVVIKIDESNNSKMRLTRGAISRVIVDDEEGK